MKLLHAILAAMFLLPLSANALTIQQHYIGGDLGYHDRLQKFPFLKESTNNNDLGHIIKTPVDEQQKSSLLSGSAYYGMAFNDKLALEFTFTYPWTYKKEVNSSYGEDNYDPNYPGYKDKFEIKGLLFDITAVYRPISSTPGFFLRGGVSHSSVQASMEWPNDVSTNLQNGHTYKINSETYDKKSGFGMVFGLGYDHPIYQNVHVRASFTRSRGSVVI